MAAKLYGVHLTADERQQLLSLLRRGQHSARVLTRARMLLLADEGRRDEEIAGTLHVSPATIYRIRKRYAEAGLRQALCEKPRPGAPPKVTSRLEAQLTALACSQPPEGRSRWTLRRLADKVVELEFGEAISHPTVRRLLKKTNSNHG